MGRLVAEPLVQKVEWEDFGEAVIMSSKGAFLFSTDLYKLEEEYVWELTVKDAQEQLYFPHIAGGSWEWKRAG